MVNRKIIGLLALFIAVCFSAHGQGSNVAGDAVRLSALIKKGRQNINNADSLLDLVNQITGINKTLHDKTAIVYTGYFSAQSASLKSDYYKSMQLAVSALNNAQKWDINQALPEIYALIGTLHKENTNYPMAFIAAEKGLDAAKQNKDTTEIIQLLGLKAMFKRGYSLHFNQPVDKDSSLIIRMQGLKIAESNPKYERLRIPFYDNIAQHYNTVKDYEKAKYFAQKGIYLALKYHQKRSLTYSYSSLGQAFCFSGNLKDGMAYLNKALQITMDIKQPYRKMEIYDDMGNCYKNASDYKSAFFYLTKYRWLVDSLQVRANEKQIGELQIKYETAKKDEALALANEANFEKSRQLIWLFGVVLMILLFIVILAYMYGVIRTKNKSLVAGNEQINEQSAKLKVLMKELHHRVKNNLQIVSSLLNLQSNRVVDSDARLAMEISRQRIEAMSIIHNSLYQHDDANRVYMLEFVPVLVKNILESFGVNREDIDISTEILINDIDVDIAMPLGLIINEWVTNIYKHAYKDMQGRPFMKILVFHNNGLIRLKISDNGVGMPLALWDNPRGSFGIKLMKILIKQIGGTCFVSNGVGTTLELEIPYVN